MQKTDNYELNLPETEDFFNLEHFNENTEQIDKLLKDAQNKMEKHTHNYAGSNSAGGAANSATKLQTARKINGVEFDGSTDINVVDDTAYQKLSCKMDKVGWYRIFIGSGPYFNSILHFVRSWGTLAPETVTLKLSLCGNGLDVSVLSHYGAIHIDKIRLVQQSVSNAYDKQRYIDLHYNANTGGTVRMLSYDNVRAFKLNTDLSETDATLNITPDELEEGYTSTEIDISKQGSYFPKSTIDELTVGSISGVNYAGSSSAGGAANSAKKLSSTRYIDGIPFDGSSNLSRLGTCATASYDTAKKVTIGAFDGEGASDAILYIQFTGTYNGGANDTHTISINDGEQLVIYYQGAVFKWETFFSNYPFCDGQIHQFRYFWSPTGSYLELIAPSNRAVANNLTTTDEKIALAAPMGKQLAETDASLQEQISTLNSNKLNYGIATGSSNVLYSTYTRAGVSKTSGKKTLVIATDSDSMAYGVFIAKYIHGTSLEFTTVLNGGIDIAATNNAGTISWTGNTGTVNVFVSPLQL